MVMEGKPSKELWHVFIYDLIWSGYKTWKKKKPDRAADSEIQKNIQAGGNKIAQTQRNKKDSVKMGMWKQGVGVSNKVLKGE